MTVHQGSFKVYEAFNFRRARRPSLQPLCQYICAKQWSCNRAQSSGLDHRCTAADSSSVLSGLYCGTGPLYPGFHEFSGSPICGSYRETFLPCERLYLAEDHARLMLRLMLQSYACSRFAQIGKSKIWDPALFVRREMQACLALNHSSFAQP
jgi:hypothetical protein